MPNPLFYGTQKQPVPAFQYPREPLVIPRSDLTPPAQMTMGAAFDRIPKGKVQEDRQAPPLSRSHDDCLAGQARSIHPNQEH